MRSFPSRAAAWAAALSLAALPARALATDAEALPAHDPAGAPAQRDSAATLAVVITQAVGVGALADRLGTIAGHIAEEAGATVLDPATSVRLLRESAGPDPLTCGTDPVCLRTVAGELKARWILAIGIGRFGGIYGLELRLLDASGDLAPASASGTWAEPGPDWESALHDALAGLLPADLREASAGRLLVRANAPGDLLVDGSRVATLPLAAPVSLAPGEHVVELRGATGSARAAVDVAAGALAEVDLVLAPAIAAEASGGQWMRTASYVAGGTAVAVLAGAVATQLSASSTMDDARARKAAGEPFAATRNDALDSIGTSRVLYGVAAGLAVGAVTLWLCGE